MHRPRIPLFLLTDSASLGNLLAIALTASIAFSGVTLLVALLAQEGERVRRAERILKDFLGFARDCPGLFFRRPRQ
jgi:hypothetical protein